jgi:hypothetical protein
MAMEGRDLTEERDWRAGSLTDVGLTAQREAVGAFITAARKGDFQGLVAVRDPDVVLRGDAGALPAGMSRLLRGAAIVASAALSFSSRDLYLQPALVNGRPGTVSIRDGRTISVAAFTVRGGKITELDIVADAERLRCLDITVVDRPAGTARRGAAVTCGPRGGSS